MIDAYAFITDSGHCADDLETPMRLPGKHGLDTARDW